MPPEASTNRAHAILSLGLAFIFTGAGFAFPYSLFHSHFPAQPERAPEILNLYSLVAWMGLSHFAFAYTGHARAVRRQSCTLLYLIAFMVSIAALFGLLCLIDAPLFNSIAWVYFIHHLLKSEIFFSGATNRKLYALPLLAFIYFSFAVYAPDSWISSPTLFLGAALSLSPLGVSSIRKLFRVSTFQIYFLISMFLIGESLLWGKYRPYMSSQFRDGVYTAHVAIASFYHYFRSYAFMRDRNQGSLALIAFVNMAVIGTGIICAKSFPGSPLTFLFGIQFFTVWVWLHQWMSDLFNWNRLRLA